MSPLGDASLSYPHAMKARTWQYGNPLVRNLVRTSARVHSMYKHLMDRHKQWIIKGWHAS